MSRHGLTCFYHPTRVLFLDDDADFLKMLDMGLSPQQDCVVTTDPQQARDRIASSSENLGGLLVGAPDLDDSDTLSDTLPGLNLANVIDFIYVPARFHYLSVVVVDYDMAGENGIEFCRSIHGSHVLKIMLTGAADQSTAIQAFNEGIIDNFILKTESDLHQVLLESIRAMQAKYFSQLSNAVLNNLSAETQALMASDAYQNVFEKVKAESNAVEYYLIDTFGSFLFLDEKGNPTWFIVRGDNDFDRFLDMAEGYDASDTLKNALKTRKKLLFLLTMQDMKKPIAEWDDYLYEAVPLGECHHCSIISEKTLNTVDWDRLATYTDRSV